MVDGVLLLVDASEGPLPQTRFVLRKALEAGLPPIVVINKIDRPDARADEVLNEVFDLFIDLDATEEQLDFPVLYCNARAGRCGLDRRGAGARRSSRCSRRSSARCRRRARPRDAAPAACHQPRLRRLRRPARPSAGSSTAGCARPRRSPSAGSTARFPPAKVSLLYGYEGLQRVEIAEAGPGDIVAIAGLEDVSIGETLSERENPRALPRIQIDEPTISMVLSVNDSPFSGRDGKHVTSRKLKERLEKEALTNVSIRRRADRHARRLQGLGPRRAAARDPDRDDAPRGLRAVGRQARGDHPPRRRRHAARADGAAGDRLPGGYIGVVTQQMGVRKGRMTKMINHGSGRVRIEFRVPSRGLIGFRSRVPHRHRAAPAS